MKIFVKSPILTFELNVESNDTILNIKSKIQEEKKYPASQIILIFGGKRLDDEKTLADYNINNECTINMVRQIKCCEEKCIYVESNGNKIELKICLCRKVLLLKEFIEKIIGLKPEFQELSLNGKIFNNDNDELSSLGVEENSIIELKINLSKV